MINSISEVVIDIFNDEGDFTRGTYSAKEYKELTGKYPTKNMWGTTIYGEHYEVIRLM